MTDKMVMILEQLARMEDKIDYIISMIDQEITEDDYDDADMTAAFGRERNGNEVL